MIKKIKKTGFTLVELLVVIAIIGILTIVSLSSFTSANIKARDAQRKADLDALSKALMMYYNDNGSFPDQSVINNLWGNVEVGFTGPNAIVYIRKMPKDYKSTTFFNYVYKTDFAKKYFNIFANLENRNDDQCKKDPNTGVGIYDVLGSKYCYGISSPNEIVKTTWLE